MEEEKCKKCIMNDENKKALIEFLTDETKKRPSALQIIAFGMSCFALGISISNIIIHFKQF